MRSAELIETAKRMRPDPRPGAPYQSDLKRAISTVYYAMFHALCQVCADGFIGKTPGNRCESAWRQTYRSVEHGTAKARCSEAMSMNRFPKAVRDFAEEFVNFQVKRHKADYDPNKQFRLDELDVDIATAEVAILRLAGCTLRDKRSFAAWILMSKRGL